MHTLLMLVCRHMQTHLIEVQHDTRVDHHMQIVIISYIGYYSYCEYLSWIDRYDCW